MLLYPFLEHPCFILFSSTIDENTDAAYLIQEFVF